MFTCQPTKGCNCSRSGVNVRARLLRNNLSRNFSSIRSGPLFSQSMSLDTDTFLSVTIKQSDVCVCRNMEELLYEQSAPSIITHYVGHVSRTARHPVVRSKK